MSGFSATGAFASGFKMIGRAPLAPLAWGALTGLAFLPTQLIQLTVFWPNTLRGYGEMLRASRLHETMPAPPTESPGMLIFSLLMMPVGLVIWSVVAAAAMRAVLEPEQKRFFYLRLGARELWLMLVALVQVVLAYASIFLMMIVFVLFFAVGAGVAAAIHSVAGIAIGVIVGVVVGILAALAVLWLLMRFSLAGPMTLHDGQFRLFESWRMTRGHGWKLVGLALLVVLSMLVFELFFLGAAGGLAAAFGLANLGRLQSVLLAPEDWMGRAMPVILVGLLAATLAWGYFWGLMIAPWADAYRQIVRPQRLEEVF